MRTQAICGFLFILSCASTRGTWAVPAKACSPKVKESVAPPHGWVKHGRPAPDHIIVLRIGLPQPNFPLLEKHLYEVSDPDHERYGAHLSKEEVERLVAPHQESIDLVNEWLETHGIKENALVRSPAKDWVTLKVPIDLAEKMLDTVSVGFMTVVICSCLLPVFPDISRLEAHC
jgi:tripeptidyl-peptidase-1